MNTKSNRIVSFDLVRVISIILICFAHAAMSYIVDESQLSFTNYSITLLDNLGTIADLFFFGCSFFLLIKRYRPTYSKVYQILMDEFLISVIGLIIALICRVDMSKSDFIESFFPTFTFRNWFVPSYLILYLVFPLVNYICIKVNNKIKAFIVAFLFILYLVLNVFFPDFKPNLILLFFSGYFLTYIVYDLDENKRLFKKDSTSLILGLVLFLIYLILISLIFFLKFKITFIYNHYSIFENALIVFDIPIIIFLINYLRKVKLNIGDKFTKIIIYISSLSLPIYLIHENAFFRWHLRTAIYKFLFNEVNASLGLLWVIVMGLFHFVFGLSLAILYKYTFQKGTIYLSKKIDIVIKKIFFNKKETNN